MMKTTKSTKDKVKAILGYEPKIDMSKHSRIRRIWAGMIPHTNINGDTHGHFSDDEIMQILDGHGEVVAFSYIHRYDMNCAEVIMVDLLEAQY